MPSGASQRLQLCAQDNDEQNVGSHVLEPCRHFSLRTSCSMIQHPPLVERSRFEHDPGLAVMAVQIPALAGIVQQPVAIAEIDFLTDTVHRARYIGGRARSGGGAGGADFQSDPAAGLGDSHPDSRRGPRAEQAAPARTRSSCRTRWLPRLKARCEPSAGDDHHQEYAVIEHRRGLPTRQTVIAIMTIMTDEAIHKSPLQAGPRPRAHGPRAVIGQSKNKIARTEVDDRERRWHSEVDEWCKFSAI